MKVTPNSTEAPIIPASPVLYMGEDKTLSVVAHRSLGSTELEVEIDPEGVIELIDSLPGALVDHPRREDCLIGRIRIRPLIEDEETLLTVRCGEHEAIGAIEVRSEREEPEPAPPVALEFERARYQLAHKKRRNLKLRAPVESVNDADSTHVRVRSSGEGVVVLGGVIRLEFVGQHVSAMPRGDDDDRRQRVRPARVLAPGLLERVAEQLAE